MTMRTTTLYRGRRLVDGEHDFVKKHGWTFAYDTIPIERCHNSLSSDYTRSSRNIINLVCHSLIMQVRLCNSTSYGSTSTLSEKQAITVPIFILKPNNLPHLEPPLLKFTHHVKSSRRTHRLLLKHPLLYLAPFKPSL